MKRSTHSDLRSADYHREQAAVKLTAQEAEGFRALAQRVAILVEAGRLSLARRILDEYAAPLDPLLMEFSRRLELTLHEAGVDGKIAELLHRSGVGTCRDFLDRAEAELLRIPGFNLLSLERVTVRLAELGLRRVR